MNLLVHHVGAPLQTHKRTQHPRRCCSCSHRTHQMERASKSESNGMGETMEGEDDAPQCVLSPPQTGKEEMIQHGVFNHDGSETKSSWCHHVGGKHTHTKSIDPFITGAARRSYWEGGTRTTSLGSVLKGSFWNLELSSQGVSNVLLAKFVHHARLHNKRRAV